MKPFLVGSTVIILSLLLSGCLGFRDPFFKGNYELIFELEMKSLNTTNVIWPIPIEKNEDDRGNISISKLMFELTVESTKNNIEINVDDSNLTLVVTFEGNIKIIAKKKFLDDENDFGQEWKNYEFNDLSNQNETWGHYNIYSSKENLEVIFFRCEITHHGSRDDDSTVDFYVRDLTLSKGWNGYPLK